MKLARFPSIFLFLCLLGISCATFFRNERKKPTVLVAILARNKAHTLPHFLSFFDRLKYPKERMHLWIRSDNNVDNTIEVLSTWLNDNGKRYHGVNVNLDRDSRGFHDESNIADWSTERFHHVIQLREDALNYGRNIWADFIWMLDADVFLVNPNVLDVLVEKNETVVAPLLKSDGMYSNFWAGMTEEYYYLRTESYEPILFGEDLGCFNVLMVHSAVLVDLRKTASDRLTYDPDKLEKYDGPTDDIITFAVGAKQSDIPLFVCNEDVYGFVMVPLESDETMKEDMQRLINIKAEILAHDDYLPLSKNLEKFARYPTMDRLNFDRIYMINLLRRPERRNRMYKLFKELGIDAETVDAVDGRTLDDAALKKWGVELMPEYADPYHKRPMTTGEIGCFLSHYVVWKKVLTHGLGHVMVLEDDVRFEPFFRQKVDYILAELDALKIEWDLVYLGRKRLVESAERWVQGSKYLVRAAYSYWTLGYLLSNNGARKLVEAMPLKKLVPVDEYLPILSDAHPRKDWKVKYPKRDLVVLSANPLLVHPTHYTGEHGYISDTENSTIVSDESATARAKKREEL